LYLLWSGKPTVEHETSQVSGSGSNHCMSMSVSYYYVYFEQKSHCAVAVDESKSCNGKGTQAISLLFTKEFNYRYIALGRPPWSRGNVPTSWPEWRGFNPGGGRRIFQDGKIQGTKSFRKGL
jgi:hypothetical protein